MTRFGTTDTVFYTTPLVVKLLNTRGRVTHFYADFFIKSLLFSTSSDRREERHLMTNVSFGLMSTIAYDHDFLNKDKNIFADNAL